MADNLKLKGPVREIGIIRDNDRHDSFNITIGITIKTEGKVSYEEAERLSTKFRREYLGKDVEFHSIHIPCPYCDKILNSEAGVKQHILKIHPEKAELISTPKAAAKVEKEKNSSQKKAETNVKRMKAGSRKKTSANTRKVAKKKTGSKSKKNHSKKNVDVQEPARSRVKVENYKPEPMFKEPEKRSSKKKTSKAKQLTLA